MNASRPLTALWLAVAGLISSGLLLLPLAILLLHVAWNQIGPVLAATGWQPLQTSFWCALLAMGFIVLLGTPTAWLLARRRTWLWQTVEFLLLIPLLMPPLVIGLLLVYAYGPYGPIGELLGHFNVSATNSSLAVIIAQVYEAGPYYIVAAQTAFSGVDQRLELTSLALGKSPWQTFQKVTLPLALPGLITGFTVGFARAIGAFGAVIVMAYYPHTLPVSVWVALQEQGMPTALPLALVLLAISLPLPLLAVIWRRWRHAAL